MMKLSWTATSAAACALALGLEVIALAGWFHAGTASLDLQAQQVQASASTQFVPAAVAAAPVAVQPPSREDSYYAQLRSKIHWVETRIGSDKLLTPDDRSRVLLAKSAAERARLQDVGLSFKDVYGIINAETSWIPRMGASKDGTPNLGLAQFEPATARALGLRNPNDPVEAIHVAALHMKEAAEWSANRIANLKLGAGERAEKLREGVSIFYNLSTKGRNRWNGRNTAKLPIETQLHIRNARSGAQVAAELDKQASAGLLLVGG
jgi:soluble lytic murein transglycosylase-like protein